MLRLRLPSRLPLKFVGFRPQSRRHWEYRACILDVSSRFPILKQSLGTASLSPWWQK